MIGFLEKQRDEVLKAHQFNEDGTPKSTCIAVDQAIDHTPIFIEEKHVISALAFVEQAMRKRDLSEEEITKAEGNVRAADYEKPEDTINISVDDVGVKQQKEQRRDCDIEKREATGKSDQSASNLKDRNTMG